MVTPSMQKQGMPAPSKRTLIGIAVFVQALLIYIVIYTTLAWSNRINTIDIFQRPHEQHKIKIRRYKHKFPFDELETTDQEKLVNLTNFKYININEAACGNSDIFILILIPSAPQNKQKRDTIRKTWGEKQEDIKCIFMLGISKDNTTKQAIERESKLHADIIQGNFIDAYKNMTYKTVMGLKYVIYHCPQAIYVLKVDDDSFVNTHLLKNFLKHDISPYGAENLFLCNDMTGSPALREPNSKWYVSKDEFPDKFYPSYCSGWYAILSPDICFKLYKESQKLKYLYIDDAFVYGIAANRANLTHIDISYHTLTGRNIKLLFNGTYDNIPIMFGSPNMSPKLIQQLYDYFKNKPVLQSIHKKLGKN